ncbi:MipA/OmpV family protein [Amaricoccus solimangrovi]|uniref:MipA/OmpV family protein n=1 Tax=Amaricoccus solimangrovi TaxID=2589815 RepID=A0A501X1C3_9RHOB|nr:MipA/OmpV family protein [Amaricoccus solimangrovi]TPE53686.1 MipA/OmpV family protein [Amaricoccus solimangrovi]
MLFWTAPASTALARALAPAARALILGALLAGAARAEEPTLAAPPAGGAPAVDPTPGSWIGTAHPLDDLYADVYELVRPPVLAPGARTTGILPAFIYGNGMFDAEQPDFVATIRGGVRFSPAYFGSTTIRSGPDIGLRLDRLELPGGVTLGSNDAVGFLRGFGPRLSARYIRARNSDDYDEIRGLDDVPFSLELGGGLGYERHYYRAYADLRYGVIGNHAWSGELGADGIAYPYEGLTLTLGPRVSFGSQRFMDTYFGVSPSEAETSGLPAYQPGSGVYGAGMELGARYLFNERWGIEGAARWTRLTNGAADSPIVENGSDDQYTVRFDLSRRISLDF